MHPVAESAQGTPASEVRFTLVHGTFARKKAAAGKSWVTNKDSFFRTDLAAALKSAKVTIDDGFRWSGRNSHKDRTDGGDLLETYLLDRPENPAVPHFIVAHSHGGNIALYALRNPKVRKRIDGLVCMATPFLLPRRRVLQPALLIFSVLFFVIFAIFRDLSPLQHGLAIGFAVTYALLALIVLVSRVLLGKEALDRRLHKLSHARLERDELLVIRPSGDEASGALRASQFATWLLGKIWGFLSVVWRWFFAIGMAVLFLVRPAVGRIVGATDNDAFVDRFNKVYSDYADPVFMFLMAAAAVMFILMVLARLVFGWKAFRWVIDIETTVEDAPAGSSQVIVLPTESADTWRLAHTEIYDRPETIDGLARWVKERVVLRRMNLPE